MILNVIPASLSRVFSVPKRCLLSLKDDLLKLKLEKQIITTFAKKHPLVSFKLIHEVSVLLSYPLIQALTCPCSQSSKEHMVTYTKFSLFSCYRHFFDFVFDFNTEKKSYNNFFSSKGIYCV